MQTCVRFCMKRIAGPQGLLLLGLLFAFILPATHAQAQSCATGPLVPKCGHPYLGAYAYNYSGATGTHFYSQLKYHESRIGRNVSIAHAYNSPSQNNNKALTPLERHVAGGTANNTYLLVDWDLTDKWADASSGAEDRTIDSMARSISLVGNTVFLALGYEPQGKVSKDSNCTKYGQPNGSDGSAANYVDMWHHVHNRFAADNVTNVVWVLIYQSYQTPLFNCMVPDLYPGDSYVDWVAADIYDTRYDHKSTGAPIGWHTPNTRPENGTGIGDQVYTEFSNDGFGNKPWMVSEFGSDSSLDDAVTFYRQIRDGLDEGVFPNFQAYLVFDNYCSQIEYSGPCTQPGTPPHLDTAKQKVYINQVADFPAWHATPPVQ